MKVTFTLFTLKEYKGKFMNKLKRMVDFLLSSVRPQQITRSKRKELPKDQQLAKIQAAKEKRIRKATRGW